MGVHVEAEDSAELVGIYTCFIYGKVLPALLSVPHKDPRPAIGYAPVNH